MGILTARRLQARRKADAETAAAGPVVPDAERTATKRANVAESRAAKAEAENEALKKTVAKAAAKAPTLIAAPTKRRRRGP